MAPNPTCKFCGTDPNPGEVVCDSERNARQCPWMGESDWKRYNDAVDKARAWDAIVKARADERETILKMLVSAANQRDCFHVGGDTLKNGAGTFLFIDASRIDALIDAIRARGVVGGPGRE